MKNIGEHIMKRLKPGDPISSDYVLRVLTQKFKLYIFVKF